MTREPLQASRASADAQPSRSEDHNPTRLSTPYSIESTVRDLLGNDTTKAIIEQHLPGFS
jgi:hypothetical protein